MEERERQHPGHSRQSKADAEMNVPLLDHAGEQGDELRSVPPLTHLAAHLGSSSFAGVDVAVESSRPVSGAVESFGQVVVLLSNPHLTVRSSVIVRRVNALDLQDSFADLCERSMARRGVLLTL